MKAKKVSLIVSLFFSTQSHAFDWDKCNSDMEKYPVGIDVFILSSQFSSSWGGCSMLGDVVHDKKLFIAYNLDHLRSDSARGAGEYLSAYSYLSGCSETASQKLIKLLRSNFTQVFGQQLEYPPKQAYEQIEQLIFDDPELRIGCKLRT